MSQQIVNEWTYGDQNTNTWLHDGDVERSAADIIALAASVSDKADEVRDATTTGIAAVNEAGSEQMAAIEGVTASQVAIVEAAGAEQKSAVEAEGDAQSAAIGDATTGALSDIQDAGTTQIGSVNSAGASVLSEISEIRDEVVQAETLIVNALGGDDEGTAQEFIDRVVSAADDAEDSAESAAASAVSAAASAAAVSADLATYQKVDTKAWSGTTDYQPGALATGSNGDLFVALLGSGPSTAAVNPVGDASGTWERVASQGDIDDLESAVSTLDANVVKLSGNQTVGGTKTFTSNVIITDGTCDISQGTSDSALRLRGGINESSGGAALSLFGKSHSSMPGYFRLFATTDSVNSILLEGRPDGTLRWDGKDFVYTSTDQDITGVKTFKAGANADSVTIKSTGITYNTLPSSTAAQGILRFRSNDDYATGVVDIVRHKTGVQYFQFMAWPYNGTTGKGFRITADGTSATAVWRVEPSDNGAIIIWIRGFLQHRRTPCVISGGSIDGIILLLTYFPCLVETSCPVDHTSLIFSIMPHAAAQKSLVCGMRPRCCPMGRAAYPGIPDAR